MSSIEFCKAEILFRIAGCKSVRKETGKYLLGQSTDKPTKLIKKTLMDVICIITKHLLLAAADVNIQRKDATGAFNALLKFK